VVCAAHFDPDYSRRPAARTALEQEPEVVALHAEQTYEYLRPTHIGDVLTIRTRAGRNWSKQGRAGQLRFQEEFSEYPDQQGELVLTAREVGVTVQSAKTVPQ
jgi:acyl-CoA thioesterase FadM